MKNILVLHGPNLNLLGEREAEIYGKLKLSEINLRLRKQVRPLGMKLRIYQSNSEGTLIDLLHRHRMWAEGVVFNPGAYSHYSYALRDAVKAISVPTVEVHLSDLSAREEFRKVSVIEPVCVGQITGLGWKSYSEGIQLLFSRAHKK